MSVFFENAGFVFLKMGVFLENESLFFENSRSFCKMGVLFENVRFVF